MKLQIVSLMVCLLFGVQEIKAQYVQTNPLEWVALAEGNEAINKQVQTETEGQMKTAILQNTIAAEFNKIHEWERSREVGTWYDRIQSVNERPPQPPRQVSQIERRIT